MKIIKVILLNLLFISMSNISLAYEIKEIEPSEIKSTIRSDSRIRLIFMFTSWCSVCKRSLPQIMEMKDSFDSKKVDIMLLSLDDNNNQIRNTLRGYEGNNFTVYRITQEDPREVLKALLHAGIFYQGSVPHSTLIDSNGEIVVNGNYQISSLKKGIEYLIKHK